MKPSIMIITKWPNLFNQFFTNHYLLYDSPNIPTTVRIIFNHFVYVLLQVLKSHTRCDDHLGDFCDGSLFKSHSLFSSEPEENSLYLQLILYYDDLEVTNPLASSKGKHKLGILILNFNKYQLFLVFLYSVILLYFG